MFSSYLNNTAICWCMIVITAIVLYVVLSRLRAFLAVRLESLANPRNQKFLFTAASLVRHTNAVVLLIVSSSIAVHLFDPASPHAALLLKITISVLVLQAVVWLSLLAPLLVRRMLPLGTETSAQPAAAVATFTARIIFWTLGLLMLLSNLGVDITALIAGLGIGGVAVALALQNLLGDLLGSVSIILDRPFIVGDFIVVGEVMGAVERIGIKTTRLRSLSGEELVLSNADLLSSRIRNYKNMYERRIEFSIHAALDTPVEKVESLVQELTVIIRRQKEVRFDRAHFKSFTDSGLVIEAVYFVLKPDYNLYMDCQQSINLAILKKMEELGVAYGIPAQNIVYRASDEWRTNRASSS